MKKLLLLAITVTAMLTLLVSCGGGGGGGSTTPAVTTPPATTPETYTVSFVIDGVSSTVEVRKGELPVYTGTALSDKTVDGKTYSFAGWDKEIAPATADATYTAVFKRVLTVRWVLQNGVLSSTALADEIPLPPANATETLMTDSTVYVFKSWNKTPAATSESEYDAAGGALTYVALYDEAKRPYTATFMHNGAVLGTSTVLYGEKPVFTGTAPTKEGYTYCGFTNTEKAALGDVVCESFFSMLDPIQLLWSYGQDDMSFDPTGKNDNRGSVFEESSGLIYMLLEIRQAPSDSTFAAQLKEKVLRSMKYFVSDEGCMAFFSLEPYWCYVPLTAVTLLAKETPGIWDSLSTLEQQKYTFMMQSLAYVLNYGNSDGNNYKTGPGYRGNFHKSWNPNYRIANVIPMLFIGAFFGGAQNLDTILLAFDYDATIAKFTEYGWTRAITEWTAEPPTFEGETAPSQKQTMENGGTTFFVSGNEKTSSSGVGVRTPFRWGGKSSDDVVGILKNVFDYNYSGGAVISEMQCRSSASAEWERAYILDGTKSPYEGMMGMMLELGKENRSSTTYARDDFTMICSALAVLGELDMYDLETDGYEGNIFSMVWIGNMDYLYKIAHGYKSFATSGTPYSKECYEVDSMAHYLWKTWWMDNYGNKYTKDTLPEYVKPFDPNLFVEDFNDLDIDLKDVGYYLDKVDCTLDMQAASPKTGVYYKTITDPSNPANKYLAFGVNYGGGGINFNLSSNKLGLTSLGESMKMRLSFKLAKDPEAETCFESHLRLRGPGGSSDGFKIFSTTAKGEITVLGEKINATITDTMQEFVIVIDFNTGALSVSVDGTEKVNMIMTIAENHTNTSLTSATTILDWAKTTAKSNFVFNWYVVANASNAHRGFIIDDLSYTAIVD